MNVSPVITREYENKSNWTLGENKANTKPIKPNLLDAQMNINLYVTKDYENIANWTLGENKPNTNPTCRGVAQNPTPKACPEPRRRGVGRIKKWPDEAQLVYNSVWRLVSSLCMKIRIEACLNSNKIQFGRLGRVVLH
jgi:hypothetical protein